MSDDEPTIDIGHHSGAWRLCAGRRYGLWVVTPFINISWWPRDAWRPLSVRQRHPNQRWYGSLRIARVRRP